MKRVSLWIKKRFLILFSKEVYAYFGDVLMIMWHKIQCVIRKYLKRLSKYWLFNIFIVVLVGWLNLNEYHQQITHDGWLRSCIELKGMWNYETCLCHFFYYFPNKQLFNFYPSYRLIKFMILKNRIHLTIGTIFFINSNENCKFFQALKGFYINNSIEIECNRPQIIWLNETLLL